jgi:large subunit ribosomal protein L23
MNSRQAHIIIRPLLNEKAASLSALGKYTFEVAKDANKIEIAQAIQSLIKELYPKNKSKVTGVNTLPIRNSRRRFKSRVRIPKDSKKAIVQIEGDPLDFYSA